MALKSSSSDPLERALEVIYGAEFLMIVIGPDFADDVTKNPFDNAFCTPSLVSQPNKFMGYWGEFYNRYVERHPHDGFGTLKRWKDQFFNTLSDDIRKRKVAIKKKTDEDEEQKIVNHRCFAVTASIDSYLTRIGFEQDQVMEIMGNITNWQCSIPCKNDVWAIDKKFRFEIDGTNQEALPIKYSAQDMSTQTPCSEYVIFDEEEEIPGSEGHPENSEPTKKRILRRKLGRATTIRIVPSMQRSNDGNYDKFENPPMSDTDSPDEVTFPLALLTTEDKSSQRVDGLDDDLELQDDLVEEHFIQPYHPLPFFSHSIQHIRAISRQEYSYHEGLFQLSCDPAKMLEQRKGYYSNVQPFFSHEDPRNEAFVRERRTRVWYNISLVIVDADTDIPIEPQLSSTNWTQGRKGIFYFSNVRGISTFQEPTKRRFVDVVRIDFPTDIYSLPHNAKLSFVVETLVKPKSIKPAKGSGTLPAVPHPFKRIAFQLIGSINFTKTTAAGQSREHNTDGGHGGRNQRDRQKEGTTDSIVEHVLETSERTLHSVKIGVNASKLRYINYLHFEIACDDEEVEGFPKDTDDVATVHREEKAATLDNRRRREMRKAGAARPTSNHQLCKSCHNTARPHVQMAAKDLMLVPISKKSYQNWEKWVLEQMKLDSGKLLIIELGCSKKMEACRRHSEMVWKKVKTGGRAHFLRISFEEIETKKGGGGGGEMLTIHGGDPKEVIKKLDRMLAEKVRKKLQQ